MIPSQRMKSVRIFKICAGALVAFIDLPISVWTPVDNFTLACSQKLIALVGGSDEDNESVKYIQVAEITDLAQKLAFSNLELHFAPRSPSVVFGSTNFQ